jgi:thiol-disulfide isomerase/thioredoxin
MKYKFVLILAIALAACSPAAQSTIPPTSTTSPVIEPTQLPPTAESAESLAGGAQAVSAGYTPRPWATLPLIDARTGATFTLADYAGKTVFVEPMATWCTTCRRQIPNVETARQQLDPEKYVFVGLSVAENVDNATLAQYVNDQGWNFPFAVASVELTEALVLEYGRTVVTPPSTPHFIIRPDGSPAPLVTGSHDSAALIAELKAISGEA